MKINQFSQIGKRSNNEDSLGTSAALLTVCDGMGGHNYGERASAFVKEAMLKAFAVPQQLGKMEIQQQLNQVQTDLNQLLEKEPELEKMGTTFTGVFITPDVWYAAHIGDSRIYLFRPSETKLWHTWDHSLVGELMRTKEITIEAGRFHPMSNRISKAIIAQKDGNPVNASIVKIDELKKGDIFLLCSDGVVEGWGDWELVNLFSDESLSFDQKCKKLAKQCDAKSKDNNTAIIAEIGEEDAFSFGSNDELEWTTFAEVEANYNQYVKDNEEVEEEKPRHDASEVEAPATSKPVEETPKQEAPQRQEPQPAPSPRQVPRSVSGFGHEGKKASKKPLALLLALLLLAVIGLVMFMKHKPEAPDPDTQAYNACNTVVDYRAYLSKYGPDAIHYADAKAFIDNYEADSIQKALVKQSKDDAQAAQNELERREKEAYDACTTIGACDSYLRVYPKGKYVKEVKAKKAELEKQAKDEAEAKAEAKQKAQEEAEAKAKAEAEQKAREEAEAKAKAEAEQKAQAEAEKKEDDAYKKCTTIKACENYLHDYPNGRYTADVQAKLSELRVLGEGAGKPTTKENVKNDGPTKPAPSDKNGGKGDKSKMDGLSDEQKEIIRQVPDQKTGLNNNDPDTGTNRE